MVNSKVSSKGWYNESLRHSQAKRFGKASGGKVSALQGVKSISGKRKTKVDPFKEYNSQKGMVAFSDLKTDDEVYEYSERDEVEDAKKKKNYPLGIFKGKNVEVISGNRKGQVGEVSHYDPNLKVALVDFPDGKSGTYSYEKLDMPNKNPSVVDEYAKKDPYPKEAKAHAKSVLKTLEEKNIDLNTASKKDIKKALKDSFTSVLDTKAALNLKDLNNKYKINKYPYKLNKNPSVVDVAQKDISVKDAVSYHNKEANKALNKNNIQAYRYHTKQAIKLNEKKILSQLRSKK